MSNDNNEKWIGIEEAADYLGVKPSTLRDWIKREGNTGQKDWQTVEIQMF